MHFFKNFIILLTMSFSFLQTSLITAEILEIREIDSVRNIVDKDTVVFFNITDTLLKPSTTMFSYEWRQYFLEQKKIDTSGYTKTLVRKFMQGIPIEETTSQIITELQKNKIPVFGIIQECEFEISHYYIRFNGIHFENSLKYVGSQKYSDLYGLYNGILLKKNGSLYTALDSFLHDHGLTGKNIVIVDSSENTLKKIEKVLSKKGIVFTGLRYINSNNNEYNQNFDKTLGNIQFPIFIDENRIISDEEAKQIQAENPAVNFEKKLFDFFLKFSDRERARAYQKASEQSLPFM